MKNLLLLIVCACVFALAVSAQESDRDKGIGLFQSGNYSESTEALRKVVEADNRDKVGWLYLGASLVKLGKDKEALTAFRKISGVNIKDPADAKRYDPPLKIVRKKFPSYTSEARNRGLEGTITVVVEFRADGKIGFVFPFTTLEGGLTENAINAARAISFEPAVLNGQPVTVVKILTYSFKIQ